MTSFPHPLKPAGKFYTSAPESALHPSCVSSDRTEREVLGWIALYPELLRGAMGKVTTSDFATHYHQSLFKTMLALAEDGGGRFDAAELAEKWKGGPNCDDEIVYISRLFDAVPDNIPLPDKDVGVLRCVGRLQKFAQLRRLEFLGHRMQEQARTVGVDPSELLARMEFAIDGLQRGCDLNGDLLPYSPPNLRRLPDLLTLSSVECKAVDWMWNPYLIYGMLGMLSGDPGSGKTFISLAIAAALTVGRVPYCGEPCLPVDVLYLSTENAPEYVLRPRFDKLEGNARRFHVLRGSVVGEGDKARHEGLTLSDIGLLEEAIKRTSARLLIVDPIQSYLGAEVDVHRSNETRPVLDGLARLAEKYRACILMVRHFAKSTTGHAIHRGLGSIDLTGAARTELHAGVRENQHAMVHAKTNMGQFGKSLGYEIVGDGIFRWTGETSITANDLAAVEPAEQDRDAVDEAAACLSAFLNDGAKPLKDVMIETKSAGLSESSVRRAKSKLKIKSRKAGLQGGWEWFLPEGNRDAEA